MKVKTKADYRVRRHLRLRKRIHGTAERPRMSVFMSLRHATVQFIDDAGGATLASVSTQAGDLKAFAGRVTLAAAKKVGEAAAGAAKARGIAAVVFDRGGFRFGGRIRALADAAREAGLKF
ncbi:MAG: 50S ribosomal protein L18 [Verrucomicrobia bacterium]|jgi:large subunit ribosomal protein L18|nr:50S ribosomal protein L18 [Verrucomicrobiota bacterium]OQW97889.1 MAG: 50S ribosomal protein L18 [Verrucomicrobia bacterium A1]